MSFEYSAPPTDVSTSAVESSPTVEQNSNVEQAPTQEAPSSAETLKTELANANSDQTQQQPEHEKYVPYERFQEMVKARQELEQQLKTPDWDGFQKLNTAIQTDPGLGQAMMEAVASYYKQLQGQNPTLQQPAAQQVPLNPADPLSQVAMAQQAQQQQLQFLMQQQQAATYNRYVSEFDNKVSALKVPDHWKPIYRNAVEQMVGSTNPNALMQYDGNLIAQAIDTVHKHISDLQRQERASYVADKTKDNMPPSTSGSGASPRTVTGSPLSQEGRAQEFLELMRASQG